MNIKYYLDFNRNLKTMNRKSI